MPMPISEVVKMTTLLVGGLVALLCVAQSADVALGSGGRGSDDNVGTAGDVFVASSAVPDASGLSLGGVLAAEEACVLLVLADLELLDHLTKRGTISSSVFTDDAGLLRATCHSSATKCLG